MSTDIPAPDLPPGYRLASFATSFGILTGPWYEHDDDPDGALRLAFPSQPKHSNTNGLTHGGMLCTFVDVLLAQAIRRKITNPIATVRLMTDFIGPARIGDLIEGRGRVTRLTRSLAYVRGEVWIGAHPIMTATGVYRILSRDRIEKLLATKDAPGNQPS